MLLKVSSSIFVSLFVFLSVARSQVWVADYTYNANNVGEFLNSWNNVQFGMQAYATPIFNENSFSLLLDGSMNTTELARWDWKARLPLNNSWTALTRVRSDVLVANQNRWAMVMLQTSAGGSDIYTDFFLDGSQTSINGGQNVGRDQYFWMGLTYDFNSRAISACYSLDAGQSLPQNNSFTLSNYNISTTGYESSTVPIINQIIFMPGGEVTYTDFKIAAFSVPEPSALSLLAVGLGGLAMLRRRRS